MKNTPTCGAVDLHIRPHPAMGRQRLFHRASAWAPPLLLVALAALHALLYIWRVPLWQTPDEPTQFEYVAIIRRLGRLPPPDYTDTEVEHAIAASLAQSWFFEYLGYQRPSDPPQTLDDVRAIFFMPRQVGVDPPLYFALAALPLATLDGRSIEQQVFALRLLGGLFMAAAVACAQGAARELAPHDRSIAFATGLLIALQPMFVFAGIGVGNDALANLIGAALCWVALRASRRGLSWKLLATLVILGALGLLTKRTLVPSVVALALFGAGVLVSRLPRWEWRARTAAVGALTLLPTLVISALVLGSRDARLAAAWSGNTPGSLAPRTAAAPGTGQPALALPAGQDATQALLDVVKEWAEDETLRVAARVWTAGDRARGAIVVDYGSGSTAHPFEASGEARDVHLDAFIPRRTPYVHVMVRSREGTIYADHLRAESERRPGLNLLRGGETIRAGAPPDALIIRVARGLNVREAVWLLRSGRLWEPPPRGWKQLLRIFFASFWGQFGWMNIPLVIGSQWELALGMICSAGFLGTLARLGSGQGDRWKRRSLALLLTISAIGIALPILNTYLQPQAEAIVQGRYLFPAIVPVALILTIGWRQLFPKRWGVVFVFAWTIWWGLFATAAFQIIERAYHYRGP